MYLIFSLYLGALYRRTYGINLTYGIEFMNPIENSTMSAWFVLKKHGEWWIYFKKWQEFVRKQGWIVYAEWRAST